MSNTYKPQKPKSAQPRNQHIFDPWNTASTGHQRAENPYSRTTEWRDTRRDKLARQFRSESRRCDETLQEKGEKGEKEEEEGEWEWMSAQEVRRNQLGVADIRQYMGGISKGQLEGPKDVKTSRYVHRPPSSARETLAYQALESGDVITTASEKPAISTIYEDQIDPGQKSTIDQSDNNRDYTQAHNNRRRQGIFSSLAFYINGSTYPTISDHKLKRLLAEEGGNLSIHLGRRTVTHVILGAFNHNNNNNNNTHSSNGGRGGGLLAGTKLQKEILSKGGSGRGIKYVSVEWVIESIKAGKKLPEARFSPFSTSPMTTSTTTSTTTSSTTPSTTSSTTPSTTSSITTTNQRSVESKNNNKYKKGLVGAPVGQRSVYEMFNKASSSSS